ncbi:hypothetical protein BWI96_11720 [Siphonobacter sp. SORGH_AS_0500]|nr:hypothetical protein BWI96_11720 [Siphonobacter sp. SORGH_AS_0500]
MKISESYQVWLRDHFNRYEFTADSATAPKEGIYYLSTLSGNQQDTLNLFLKNIDFKRLDSRYYEDYKDGREYRFYIRTKAFAKTIYVHRDESPKELDSLVEWLKETRRRVKLVESSEEVYFRSRLWLPTPPPPPEIIHE